LINSIVNVPRHVGIIMDGNGRWATARGKNRTEGHKAGVKNIRPVLEELYENGVEVVSLYAFSTENFSRDPDEVDALMKILNRGLKTYGDLAVEKGVRLVVSGDYSLLSDNLIKRIKKQVGRTSAYVDKTLNICIAYGGRQELCRAFGLMYADGVSATPENVERYLYTSGMPPLDYVIRTGGEYRLSNFLLWQSAYAELYFTPVLWPDFNREEVKRALTSFSERKRRFGKN